MFGSPELHELKMLARRLAGDLKPGALSGPDAADWLAEVVEVRKLVGAAEVMLAQRVADTPAWRSHGHKTPAQFVAQTAGTSVGEVTGLLAAAGRLATMPTVRNALVEGKLSGPQLRHITDAVAVAPSAERALVDLAERESVAGLRRACERVRHTGIDAEALHRRAHDNRSLRHRCERGVSTIEVSNTTAAGAEVMAALAVFQERIFRTTRSDGQRERFDAYAADALVAMARAALLGDGDASRTRSGSQVKVIVRVDHTALLRGHVCPGELCEISGVGPVPISVVDDLLAEDAFLAAVVTRGHDVLSVAHLGRQFTAFQRTALEFRDAECAVLGCNRTEGLERDHRTDWAKTGRTMVDDADRLCDHHHQLKTRQQWMLEPGSGRRPMHPPGRLVFSGTDPPGGD